MLLTVIASVGALGGLFYYLYFLSTITPFWRTIYFVLFLFLFYCAFAYQVNRYGAARRAAQRQDLPDSTYDYLLAPDSPTVTVLIPSYREERRVLRMTILSAAMARYGQRRVVVLLDDPPHSEDARQSRATVAEVAELLDEPMEGLRAERTLWLRRQGGVVDPGAEAERLARLNRGLADWLDRLAERLSDEISAEFAHVDGFFVDRVVLALATHYRDEAARLVTADIVLDDIAAGYDRLARAFCTDIDCFERKRYANLSHAPNKAMNLNSYIALMGGRFDVVEADGALFIANSDAAAPEFDIPASKYVLTLDADSVILPRYMLELAHVIEHDESVGVVQTPYLTFPHSVSPVERVAGATTDIQFLVHQGSSHFDAAYWVGANALIRLAALDVIRTVQTEGDTEVDVFIQDATVIEDTGSTVDRFERLQVVIAEWENGAVPLSLWPGTRVVSGFPLSQYFNAFDFSISAAGYNTFHEVMAFALPTVFIGNTHEAVDDQVARARFAQDAGAALDVAEDELFQLGSVAEVLLDPRARDVLRANCRALSRPNGAEAAADALVRLMEGGR